MHSQKCVYGRVTQRSSMRENSPLVPGQTRAGVMRGAGVEEAAALGSRIHRVRGEVKRVGPGVWSAGRGSGGNQKKTLPSATVRSMITWPVGVS